MAKRRVARRGRSIVALALLGFIVVAAGVVWRRTAGLGQLQELRELQQRRIQLEALRARLESDIRDLASRGRLAPIAERRLHMRVPHDSQVVILPRPTSPR